MSDIIDDLRDIALMLKDGMMPADCETLLDAAKEIEHLRALRGIYRAVVRTNMIFQKPDATEAEIQAAFRSIEGGMGEQPVSRA